jgi:UDP-N-acetylglucosamine 3-dehydrogenase
VEPYRAAIIGCGQPSSERGGGFGIAYTHARAYARCPKTVLVAAADINAANLQAFCTAHDVRGYHDYQQLLAQEQPDLVSICTWPPLHPQMAIDAALAGVKGIWCEKPMALSLAEADRMLAACAQTGTRLQVNHQRRFAPHFQAARELIRSGRLGSLVRVEGYVPDWDLLSWGTHWADMIRYLNEDQPVIWVAAQVDCRTARQRYGHYVEDHSITYFAFANGVRGFLELGEGCPSTVGVRIVGTEGFAVVHGNTLRARVNDTAGWLDYTSSERGEQAFLRALEDLVASIEEQREPLLSGRSARATTEILLAAYESAYRRGRVLLPLEATDFPLARLVAAERGPAPDRRSAGG